MKIFQLIKEGIQYISEAVARIFAPNHDHYPATGVIPFQGQPYKPSRWVD